MITSSNLLLNWNTVLSKNTSIGYANPSIDRGQEHLHFVMVKWIDHYKNLALKLTRNPYNMPSLCILACEPQPVLKTGSIERIGEVIQFWQHCSNHYLGILFGVKSSYKSAKCLFRNHSESVTHDTHYNLKSMIRLSQLSSADGN